MRCEGKRRRLRARLNLKKRNKGRGERRSRRLANRSAQGADFAASGRTQAQVALEGSPDPSPPEGTGIGRAGLVERGCMVRAIYSWSLLTIELVS